MRYGHLRTISTMGQLKRLTKLLLIASSMGCCILIFIVNRRQLQSESSMQGDKEDRRLPTVPKFTENSGQRIPSQRNHGCRIYEEFRDINFQQEPLTNSLCSGAKAFERRPDGFPLCRLPNPFNPHLMSVVSNGSVITELLDLANARVKLFVYPERDLISETIKESHHWEPRLVHTTLRLAMQVPNATFLDAGCNIGVYSVLAARLGLPVVSLDANIRNLLRLRLSLDAALLDASLVWNWIGRGHQLSFLNFPSDCNMGGATKFERAVRDSIPVMPIGSSRLCGLISTRNVVIKLDIEGGETDFLRTSGCLFNNFKVAAVQMEFLRRHVLPNEKNEILNFFVSRGYRAWRSPQLQPLDLKAANWWEDGDLLWVHDDFKHLVSVVKGEIMI